MVLVFLTLDLHGQDSSVSFPTVTADDLNGKSVTLPKDLPGDPSLVLVAFTSEQQADVDKWMAALKLKEDQTIPWIEVPVIGSKFKMLRPMIDKGMKKSIATERGRSKVITLYSSKKDFMASLGLTSEKTIYALVVGKEGGVKLKVEGTPTEESKEAVLKALGR